jgi:hypothetical protein
MSDTSNDEVSFLREKVKQQAKQIEELVKKIAEAQVIGEQGLKYANDAIQQIRALAGSTEACTLSDPLLGVLDTGFGSTVMTFSPGFGYFQKQNKDENDISGAV